MHSILTFLLPLALVLPLPVLGQASSPAPIKIGALMPLTGEFAMQGAAFREGLQIAEEEVNEQGGINGRPLRLLVEDTHSDPKLANTAAHKLISIEHVVAAITTSYPETEVGGRRFQRAQIPSLALWDSSPEIDAMGDYIFAIGPWTPSGAEVGAKFSYGNLHARTAVVVNNAEPWSELIADLYTRRFESMGGKVTNRTRLNPTENDFRTLIAKLKVSPPDVLYAPLSNELVAFHTQLNAAKLSLPIVSADIITEEHILKNPPAFEGVYQSGIKDPERQETKRLGATYQKKFGKKMTMPWFVSTGYDAVKLYAFAIANAGTDGARIKDFLYTVNSFPGATQPISISSGGSSPYFYSMFRIVEGRFVLVE